MKKLFLLSIVSILTMSMLRAQQLPDNHFENWSSEYNGDKQPKDWHGSNVTQVGFKFTFLYQKPGRTGYCAYVADKEVGALGITEVGPGYFSLGNAWQYLDGIDVSSATAGVEGGIKFTYRPDSVSVWIKRTGNNTDSEDFHILYYSWTGTSEGTSYKAKDGSCTSTTHTNEESDIRIALDANECKTTKNATQVAEGWYRARAKYDNWTQIKVPIYYMNDTKPAMCNMLFSASNYPNFRANSGLYTDNALFVDDVELIYASTIQVLEIGGKEWKGFDPNSSEEQTYSLGENATTMPTIVAKRGKGTLTNARNQTASFIGRTLTGSEISIVEGQIDGAPTTITVKAEDGSSTHVYKIKFVRAASSNANLAGIQVNGNEISDFRPTKTTYDVALPYGTTTAPVVTVTPQEDAQTVNITQPTSVNGTATIKVTAANKTNTKEYKLNFSVAPLADNTLQGILVNGESVPGFTPTLTMYKVSLPLSTTTMPTVKAVSAYPAGAQTIRYTAPNQIDGGTYQIAVSTPGNTTPKTYKLTFKLEASTYSYLNALSMGDDGVNYIQDFSPTQLIYYINLPLGTKKLPTISYERGDPYQTVEIVEGGLDGTTRVTVTAASGDVTVYKLVVTTAKSEYSLLDDILIDGESLESFDKGTYNYTYNLPIGVTQMPTIEVVKGDENEEVNILYGGINGVTRISVTAQNGNTTIYTIAFSVTTSTDNSLRMIYLDGQPLDGFDPEQTNYVVNLPKGTTQLPVVTYDEGEYQTITVRSGGLNGDYKITVRPQTGASKTYQITFLVATSSNTTLQSILIDNVPIPNFRPDSFYYVDTLPAGVSTIPTVTYVKSEEVQRVLSMLDNTTQKITVTAENGDKQTYEILFVIQKSENAFLEMIYLDGEPLAGFEKTNLTYEVVLTTSTCPRITVDEAAGQQVVIASPQSYGIAQIVVTPEFGAANTYQIHFSAAAQTEVDLPHIYADGVELPNYVPAQHQYTIHYQGNKPEITWATNEGQSVQMLTSGEKVSLYVTAGEKHGVYEITCTRDLNNQATLADILLDNVSLANFSAEQLHYTIDLPAGSQLPVVTFVKADESEVTFFGQVKPNKYAIHVSAEDGTTQVYTVTFVIAQYADVALADLALSNGKLTYNPEQTTYLIAISDGEQLPDVTVTAKPGQTTMLYQVSADEQQVQVTAEDGSTRTYAIKYTRTQSGNCLLQTILLDGEPLEGFDPAIHAYIDTLEWRTRVIPNIQAVGQLPNQTITTYFCAVNGTARIHVVADNGAFSDYQIEFPVRKSGNTALSSILIAEAEDFIYKPKQYTYLVHLPYGTTAAPMIDFETQDEQRVEYIAAPLNQESKLIVTAENGNQVTYSFTFEVLPSTLDNVLASIFVNDEPLDLSSGATDFEVELPYGTSDMDVAYTKRFPEQTVAVTYGGVTLPTILTVYSNRPNEDSTVYTIKPNVIRYNPATLTGILVDDVEIEEFQPDRYSYVVPVTNVPSVTTMQAEGVEVQQKEKDDKHIVFTVRQGDYTNEYSVYYYFVNDQIPSNNFQSWSPTKYNNAQKPTGWMAPADCADSFSWGWILSSTTITGPEVNPLAGGGVILSTLRAQDNNSIYGSVPGIITIGTLHFEMKEGGNSTSSVDGSIAYRNTPDQVYMEYNPVSNENISIWRLWVELGDGVNKKQTLYEGNFSKKEWQAMTKDLDYSGLGVISRLNICLNSGNTESASKYGGKTIYRSTLQARNLRFLFNSTIASATIDGEAVAISGNAMSYNISNPEYSKLPELKIVGQKPDQSPLVTWGDEINGVRTASIRNYAEDGSYSNYSLTVTRVLSAVNTLSQVMVNGTLLPNFDANVTEYDYLVANGTRTLPDVYVIPTSHHAQVSVRYEEQNAIIDVQAETDDTKTYIIHFVEKKSNSTKLTHIEATGVDFNPSIRDYNLTSKTMPAIKSFIKESDGQVVSWNGGVFTVTAEDGITKGLYRIIPDSTTSAQISSFEFNGTPESGLGGEQYAITRERPTLTAFVRADESDSVVYTQTKEKMTWDVYGRKDAQHTYTLTYPTTLSDNAMLANILVDGVTIQDFNPQITDYKLYSDTAIALEVIGAESKQTIQITHPEEDVFTYNIFVTAANGTATKTYKVQVSPVKSQVTTLDGIYLNEVLIEGFRADSFDYVVTLPTPSIKVAEPQMPSLTYTVSDSKETVGLELGKLNVEPTYLTVRSADGMAEELYTVMVQSEPSHNADLTGIIVNGQPVERFEAGRHFYSVSVDDEEVAISWSSNDCFQEVTLIPANGSEYTIHVVAQDGVTTEDYVVDVYVASLSNDVTLKNILLNGVEFKDFERALNNKLEFSPMKNQYDINLPSGTTVLPEVSATMQMDGQKVNIRRDGLNIYLDVTAKDGINTNTYALNFAVPLSSNANLSMIFCDGDSIDGFTPDYYYYLVTLPVGVHTLPEIVAQKGQNNQVVAELVIEADKNRATIRVTAEDGRTTSTYVVVFEFERSTADTLFAIYEDGLLLPEFSPHIFNYKDTLAPGTTAFPDLSWDVADEWQQVDSTTVLRNENQLIRQINVTAEAGNTKAYTISYVILPSEVDTLQMLYVDNKPLVNFNSHVMDYYYTLEATATSLPEVFYAQGDQFQTVYMSQVQETSSEELPDSVKAVNQKIEVVVQAQSGKTRVYTIHFSMKKSSDASLNMIMAKGVNLSGFVSEQLFYRGEPLNCKESVPVITWVKKHDAQKVELEIVSSENESDTVYIHVTAEDGKTSETYRIIYEPKSSDNFFLHNLLFSDGYFVPFDSLRQDYTIEIPYGVDTVPTVMPIASEDCQTILIGEVMELTENSKIQTITVFPYNNTMFYTYNITYVFKQKADANLSMIYFNDVPMMGFKSDEYDYEITWEDGTTIDQMYTLENIKVTLSDSLAHYTIHQDSAMTFTINVQAQDTLIVNTYTILQVIGPSHDNYLKNIFLDEQPLRDFDPEKTFYTYYVPEGGLAPNVTAEAHHAKAEVTVKMAQVGDTTLIYCTAEDGVDRIYYILFTNTTLNESQTATTDDVLIKRLYGGYQILVASLRKEVDFALYDQQGHLVEYIQNMPTCSQNDAVIQTYANGRDILTDVVDAQSGIIIDVNPNQIYFYGFYAGGKQNILSGKLIIVP